MAASASATRRAAGSAITRSPWTRQTCGGGPPLASRARKVSTGSATGRPYEASTSRTPLSASSWQSTQKRAQGRASSRAMAMFWPQFAHRP